MFGNGIGSNNGTYTATNNVAGSLAVDRVTFANDIYTTTINAASASNVLLFTGGGAVVEQNGRGDAVLAGPISVAAGTTLTLTGTGLGNLSVTGVVAGSGGIVFNFPQANLAASVVTFGGTAANTFTGGVTFQAGTVRLAGTTAGSPFGTNAVTVAGASSLVFTESRALGNATLNAATVGANAVTLTADLTILGNSGTLTFQPTAVLSGAGGFVVRATSTASPAVSVASYGRYTGETTIDGSPYGGYAETINGAASQPTGVFRLSGANGAAAFSAAFNVRAGGTIELGSDGVVFAPDLVNNGPTAPVVAAGRIGDTAEIRLSSGRVILNGNASTTAVSETAGLVRVAGGGIVTTAPTSAATGGVTFAFAGLTRTDRGTLLVRGLGLGSTPGVGVGTVTFANAPALVGGIIPHVIGDVTNTGSGSSFVTYDAATGVRPLTAAEYAPLDLTGGSVTTNNARYSSATAVTVTAPTTVNSLHIAGAGAVNGAAITVASGAVLMTAVAQVRVPLAFGPTEGIVHTPSYGQLLGPLTGSGGLTKGGSGTLVLGGDLSGLTGPLTVNGGQLQLAAAITLPAASPIRINASGFGDGLIYTGPAGTVTVPNDIAVTGQATLQAGLSNPNLGTTLRLTGVVSGTGGLTLGNGVIELAATNTFTGPVLVGTRVVISSDANLGAGGEVSFESGSPTLVLAGDWTTARPVAVIGLGALDTNGYAATLNGTVRGYYAFTKAGAGALTLTGNSPYTGPVTITAGTYRLGGAAGATRTGIHFVAPGGTLELDNGTTVVADRVSNGGTIELYGGTARLVGGTVAVREQINTLSLRALSAGNRVEVVGGAAGATLAAYTYSPGVGATVEFRGAGLGANSRIDLGLTQKTLLAGATATDTTTGVTGPAISDPAVSGGAAVGIRPLAAADVSAKPALQNAAPTNVPTDAVFRVDPAQAAQVPVVGTANTVNGLIFAPGGALTYAGATASRLTLTSGVVITEAGAAASIGTTGAGTLTLDANAFDTRADLTVSATLGTSSLVKTGPAALTLTGGFTTTGGVLAVAAGTLNLGTNFTGYGGGAGGTGSINIAAGKVLTLIGGRLDATVSGPGRLAVAQTAAYRTTTLSGANGGLTADIVGNAAARVIITHPAALGTGTLDVSAQTASSTFEYPTLGFNFGAGVTGVVPTAIKLSAAAGIENTISAVTPADGSAAGQTLRLTGVVSGGGSNRVVFEEVGSSASHTLALANANNTFTGTVQVNYGTLAVTADGSLGNAANALVLGNASDSTSAPTLRFDADNVTLGASRAVTLASGSFYACGVNTQGYRAAIAGVVGGSRTLVKTGTGTLTLTGANTFTGAISVADGTLAVPVIAAAGNQPLGAGTATITLGNNASTVGTLEYTGAAAATLARSITVGFPVGGATGIVRTTGAGTLNLTAAVSVGTNTLAFDTGSRITVASNVTGTGTVRKLGGGTLLLNGTVAPAVEVVAGTLGGTGTLAGPVTVGAATLAPGTSPGTLTAAAAVTLAASSVVALELNGPAAGGYDVLALGSTGTLALNGATLALSITGGSDPGFNGETLTVVTGTGANQVSGKFGNAPASGAVLTVLNPFGPDYTATVNYTPSAVLLTLTPVPEPAGVLAVAAVAALVVRRRLPSRRPAVRL